MKNKYLKNLALGLATTLVVSSTLTKENPIINTKSIVYANGTEKDADQNLTPYYVKYDESVNKDMSLSKDIKATDSKYPEIFVNESKFSPNEMLVVLNGYSKKDNNGKIVTIDKEFVGVVTLYSLEGSTFTTVDNKIFNITNIDFASPVVKATITTQYNKNNNSTNFRLATLNIINTGKKFDMQELINTKNLGFDFNSSRTIVDSIKDVEANKIMTKLSINGFTQIKKEGNNLAIGDSPLYKVSNIYLNEYAKALKEQEPYQKSKANKLLK